MLVIWAQLGFQVVFVTVSKIEAISPKVVPKIQHGIVEKLRHNCRADTVSISPRRALHILFFPGTLLLFTGRFPQRADPAWF
jgi:hypothetical protein